ncbi:unnamed protein product [Orchesella dallaii]|uniref:Uncharacterized protein n=1 Tax=Orchesella dallaii TaxID=48710 RepID=A0ABP1QRT4_9HEXA
MPKRQSSRTGSDNGRGRGSGPSRDTGDRDQSDYHSRDTGGIDSFQEEEDKQAGGNNLGSSSVRQGSNQKFPCDANMLPIGGDPQSKVLAVNVALSVCQGLHTWAETSDLNCILQKLRHLLCIVNENGDNALHTAIHNQQREPFKKILETVDASPDISYLINEPNLNNLTPLALAVTTNSLEFVQELMDHNADITIPNSEGDNPLHIAVKTNNIDCVKCLLQSPNAQSIINRYNYSSMTALHIAILHGYADIVDLLCSHKATLTNQEGMYGRTPLHLAVDKEEIDHLTNTISLLKTAGESDIANIQNYRGDTPLHCAASLGHKTQCAILLHFGADPTIENYIRHGTEEEDDEESENGQTVFDVAANDEIKNILKASPEDWSKVYQSCIALISELNSTERETHEAKVLTADSIFLDSGINITDLNIS